MIGPVIDEMARGFGLTQFRWADQGGFASFSFERRGTLYLEERPDVLLMYLSRVLDARVDVRERLCRALRLCHYQSALPVIVQAALHAESGLVLLARLPLSEVSLPTLEHTLDLLTRLHERIEQGG